MHIYASHSLETLSTSQHSTLNLVPWPLNSLNALPLIHAPSLSLSVTRRQPSHPQAALSQKMTQPSLSLSVTRCLSMLTKAQPEYRLSPSLGWRWRLIMVLPLVRKRQWNYRLSDDGRGGRRKSLYRLPALNASSGELQLWVEQQPRRSLHAVCKLWRGLQNYMGASLHFDSYINHNRRTSMRQYPSYAAILS